MRSVVGSLQSSTPTLLCVSTQTGQHQQTFLFLRSFTRSAVHCHQHRLLCIHDLGGRQTITHHFFRLHLYAVIRYPEGRIHSLVHGTAHTTPSLLPRKNGPERARTSQTSWPLPTPHSQSMNHNGTQNRPGNCLVGQSLWYVYQDPNPPRKKPIPSRTTMF